MSPAEDARDLLGKFGIESSGTLASFSPIDGAKIGQVAIGDPSAACERATRAFREWRLLPAPRRGELVRLLGEELRAAKEPLARLVTLESGKILQESLGEVQEMIDICDFAVGLSRQLYGLTIASERPNHRMMEQWHPLGPVLVISAFNFPVAVWAWNAALALVCGNPVIWKPSEKTPLCAEAVMTFVHNAAAKFGNAPDGLSNSCGFSRRISPPVSSANFLMSIKSAPAILPKRVAQRIMPSSAACAGDFGTIPQTTLPDSKIECVAALPEGPPWQSQFRVTAVIMIITRRPLGLAAFIM